MVRSDDSLPERVAETIEKMRLSGKAINGVEILTEFIDLLRQLADWPAIAAHDRNCATMSLQTGEFACMCGASDLQDALQPWREDE